MEVEYDENIRENRFFQELREKHEAVFERATREGWIFCVPRRGSFPETKIELSEDDIAGHILIPESNEAACTDFHTLNGRTAKLVNKLLIIQDGDEGPTCSSYLLFEETFYDDQFSKYRVWCLDRALQLGSNDSDARITGIATVKDAVGFLWSEIPDEKLLKDLVFLIERFEYGCTDMESKSIEAQRDSIARLYNSCLAILMKDTRLKSLCSNYEHFYKNLRVSLETYLLYSLRGTLRRSISTCTASQDAELNKILRNSIELQLSDLEVRSDLCERIHIAKLKLSRLDRFATVLGKTECLKRTVRCLSEGSMFISSDDLLPALVFLVIKAGLSNWIAQLTFMKYFRFSASSVYEADESGFLITTLEAAIEHLRSGGFLRNLQVIRTVQTNEEFSPLSRLFRHIEKNDLQEVKNILADEHIDPLADMALCHPLCTCDMCEKKRNYENFCRQPSVNSKDDKGRTALHIATLHDRKDIIDYLVIRDAEVNAFDNEERTALHYAAAAGLSDILVTLLQANADPEMLDCNKNSPLHLAAEHGHENCVEALLRSVQKTKEVPLNAGNLDGDTPLHRASKWGYQGIVRFLLEYGASPVARNKRGQTPLSVAHNDCVSDLLVGFATSAKQFVRQSSHGYHSDSLSESDSESGIIATRLATMQHRTNTSKTGYPLDKTDRAMERLFAAISEGDTCLACYYLGLESQRKKIIKQTDDMCHPLCNCERCSESEELSEMPAGGARYSGLGINACNRAGVTALHLASALGSIEMIRVLLDAGANVNTSTVSDQRTPLHFACLCNNIEAVKLLLDCATCEVDIKDRNGDTPLHLAVKTGNAKLVRLLLRYGANTNIRNVRGVTPLQQLQQQISRDALSFPLLDISNILKRNSFENAIC